VAKAGTNVSVLVRRSLRFAGHGDNTAMTAFTDGGPGLRSILLDAGIAEPPTLDWFHIAMRMQHAAQSASALWTDEPARVQTKAMIVDKVERLRWRIWNGKAKTARRSLDWVRKVIHIYRGERRDYARSAPSRRLWHALHNVGHYLRSQHNWPVNYARRYRAGQREGSSITEGTANVLVNRRMNKSRQMRWSRRGADLLLPVRSAVYNGTLGSGFGQIFHAFSDRAERSAWST
jgi:hypothetical protein